MASTGKRLKARREQLGYTQVQLAELLGTTKQRVAHIEAGRVRLPLDEAGKWATALKSKVSKLVLGVSA